MNTTYKPTRSKGIYKTTSNTYRVRKMINGRKISKNFAKYREALKFKKTIST